MNWIILIYLIVFHLINGVLNYGLNGNYIPPQESPTWTWPTPSTTKSPFFSTTPIIKQSDPTSTFPPTLTIQTIPPDSNTIPPFNGFTTRFQMPTTQSVFSTPQTTGIPIVFYPTKYYENTQPPFQHSYPVLPGSGYGFHSPSPQTSSTNQEQLNLLSSALADFLSSLNKDQTVAFFRVYFLSQMVGKPVIDNHNPIPRSMQLLDKETAETARQIPLSPSSLKALELTGLGKLLSDYATKINSVPPQQRGGVIKEYNRAIAALQIPKGIKYALKQAVL